MRRTSRGDAWRALRDLPAHSGDCGESFADLLDAREYLARVTASGQPLAARWRLAPELAVRQHRQATGNGWQPAMVELRRRKGLALAARVDPLLAGVLGYLDGQRNLGEAAQAWAQARKLPIDPVLAELPRLAEQLANLGLLVPALDRDRF